MSHQLSQEILIFVPEHHNGATPVGSKCIALLKLLSYVPAVLFVAILYFKMKSQNLAVFSLFYFMNIVWLQPFEKGKNYFLNHLRIYEAH